MDYAVIVYFDKDSDKYISQMMKNVCDAGANSYMLDMGIRPHITLAAFYETDWGELSKWLYNYANNMNSFDIKFSSIGSFPAASSVLFLSPVTTEGLIKVHKSFNEQIKKVAANFEPNYLPGNWVPHCTLAVKLSENELLKAMSVAAKSFKTFTSTVTQIGFVQCNPFKEIATYNIG